MSSNYDYFKVGLHRLMNDLLFLNVEVDSVVTGIRNNHIIAGKATQVSVLQIKPFFQTYKTIFEFGY